MAKILIIEDEKAICDNLEQMLILHGYSVAKANNGPDGWLTIQRTHPDLILCDIKLPGMDGRAILEKLRAHGSLSHTPFIFISAIIDREEIRNGMNMGADDYITKPFHLKDVIGSVQARISRFQPIGKPALKQSASMQSAWNSLSASQKKVLRLVAMGLSTKEIADKLCISPKTAENHRCSIADKLMLSGPNAVLNYALTHRDVLLALPD
ncbi:MAG: response regulator transcription factor [Bacteroidetes bacterium]|nr:response regulator transcription factor [Bacteroidota bacterium]